ncbi:hypothetical protein, partial [Phocaeicola salanitronis]|uniref:hypothetical protein n=1 Tax=Phocaeicola salanitronis TaxID=376805 RepID=UPI0023F79A9E
TFAQVYGIVAHYKAVVFIQVEHGFFENKGRNFPQFKKHGGFRMVTLFFLYAGKIWATGTCKEEINRELKF